MGFQIENGLLEKYAEESDVKEVVIPDSVTAIGDYAFVWCSRKSMASTWRTKISTMKSTSLSMTDMPT